MNLDSTRRATLAAVADLLIPADGDARSASQADVQGVGIDRVLAVRPDLLDPVIGFLDAAATSGPNTFAEVYALGSPHFRPFAEAVTAAYYLNPDVAAVVGYAKRSVIPIVFDTDLDVLVREVTARGPVYRPTPTAPAERNA